MSDDVREGRLGIIEALAEASRNRPPDKPVAKTFLKKRPATSDKNGKAIVKVSSHASPSASLEASKLLRIPGSHTMRSISKSSKSVLSDSSAGAIAVNALNVARLQKRLTQVQALQEEARAGQALNNELMNPSNRNNPEVCQRFWSELKSRILKHYGTISEAFKKFDTSGEGSMSLLEFLELLKSVHLGLEMRAARAMFDKAAHGDGEISLEELKVLLMEKTVQKVAGAMRGWHKNEAQVRRHVHTFLKQLCRSSRGTQMSAVDRMQRKFTMPFLRQIWILLRDHLSKIHSDGDLARRSFLHVLQHAIGTHLMAHEVTYLLRLYDRIDTHRRGHIHLADFMTTLVLLSEDADKEHKLHLLFEVFDRDYDGCLLYDQILSMMRCICAHRPIAEESASAPKSFQIEAGSAFQEELTSQEGQRLYECLLWYLQRTAKLDGDIVTWSELWEAFDQQPEVANATFPGFFRLEWLLDFEADDAEADEWPESRSSSRAPSVDHSSPTMRRQSSMIRSASHRHSPQRSPARSPRKTMMQQTPGTEEERAVGSPDEAVQFLSRASSKESSGWASIRRSTFVRMKSKGGGPHRSSALSAWEAQESTAAFKRHVTSKFVTSLRNAGDVRYTELAEGFKSVEEQLAAAKDAEAASQGLTRTASQHSQNQAPRPASAVGARRPSTGKLARPASSPAVRSNPAQASAGRLPMQSGSKVRPGSAPMPHIRSSPAGLEKSRKSALPDQNISKSATALQSEDWMMSPFSGQKWGDESGDRFRLFSTVRTGKNHQRHLMGACAHGSDGMGYKCQLCLRQHVMVTSF